MAKLSRNTASLPVDATEFITHFEETEGSQSSLAAIACYFYSKRCCHFLRHTSRREIILISPVFFAMALSA